VRQRDRHPRNRQRAGAARHQEGFAEGKMLDIFQTATLLDFDTKLVGVTNDYSKTAGSDVVVITSGIPRKPGMTRE